MDKKNDAGRRKNSKNVYVNSHIDIEILDAFANNESFSPETLKLILNHIKCCPICRDQLDGLDSMQKSRSD